VPLLRSLLLSDYFDPFIIIIGISQEYCSEPHRGETLVVIKQSDITEPRSGETGLSV